MLLLLVSSGLRLYLPGMVSGGRINDYSQFKHEIELFRSALARAHDSADSARQASVHKKEIKYHIHRKESTPQSYSGMADTMTFDLNECDTLDLQVLRGIGPYFAGNIIKYREILGGYARKDQLLEVYGMDSSRYEAIAGRVRVSPGNVRQFDLNSASFKSLLKHPYLEFYVVKEIFRYRDKKPFDSVGELRQIELIDEGLYRKISPYLTVNNDKEEPDR